MQGHPQQSSVDLTCGALHVGLWNGSTVCADGSLLYQRLLDQAIGMGLRGATAWTNVEGLNLRGDWLSVENEVASNALPVWISLFDGHANIHRFLRSAAGMLRGQGVVCTQSVGWLNGQSPALGTRAEEGGRRMAGDAGIHVEVFMLEGAKVDGKPVYQAIAELLRGHHVLWVSTARGLAGYGEGRKVRGRRWFGRPEAPVTMHIVDKAEVLRPILPLLVNLVGNHALIIATEASLHA